MKQIPNKIEIKIPSELKELSRVEKFVQKIAKKTHLTNDQQDNLAIAVTEAVGNAIVHGNKKDPQKTVIISFILDKGKVSVFVKDEGKGFDLNQLHDPLSPENLMKDFGRGIFILKTLMDKVDFSFSSKGTTIKMVMTIK
jgi:serine/threonine-protein kinase RsbW